MARQPSRLDAVHGAFALNGFPLVEFDRKPIDRYPLKGFAIDWNAKLTLIQPIEDHQFRLNGYAVFRNADVKRWRAIPGDDFLAKAARLHKLRPTQPDEVTILSMKDATASAGAKFPLLTIHRERMKRGVCYIGRILRTSQRVVTMLSISAEAEWEKEEGYSLSEITLLEFGGAYEKLLMQMAKK